MRTYPRSLVIGDGKRIRVNNEMEEYEAGLKGYERHRNPEINALQKGTDKEVLRVKPVEVGNIDGKITYAIPSKEKPPTVKPFTEKEPEPTEPEIKAVEPESEPKPKKATWQKRRQQ